MRIHMVNVEEYGFWLSEFATVISVIWFFNSVGSECNPYKVEVVGSNPTGTTICGCSSVGQNTRFISSKSQVQVLLSVQQYKQFSRIFTVSMTDRHIYLKAHLKMLKYIYYRILIGQDVEYLRCIVTSIQHLRQYYIQLPIWLELFYFQENKRATVF